MNVSKVTSELINIGRYISRRVVGYFLTNISLNILRKSCSFENLFPNKSGKYRCYRLNLFLDPVVHLVFIPPHIEVMSCMRFTRD